MAGKKKKDGVIWVKNTLSYRLGEFSPELDSKIAVLVDRQADVGTRDMKMNAPWTDRTGNARATLQGEATHKDRLHTIKLHGGMPYQIWLELKNAGRFAIIGPTTIDLGKKTMALAHTLMGMMK